MENIIEKKIGYTFKNPDLLQLACTHRSYWNEHKEELQGHNERLEFLGDSVLGLLIAEHLYQTLPEKDEGTLSKMRADIVSADPCSKNLKKLGLESFLLLGKGEKMNQGKGRETILADFFEALIGAIYLDGGFEAAKKFVFTHFLQEIKKCILKPSRNWKADLQDYAQKKYQETPIYEVLEERGPAHKKQFHVAVLILGKRVGDGIGSSKKEAQMIAAKAALNEIEKW